ncbi:MULTISPECIES: DNA repair protein [unclassified Duganella]|uniref:DNA repair protein n=1 Tax=unclassified Duganella TaxID=2636909 RepID=UPI00102A98C8|nr:MULTISPECIES: DNA repair protein [unclassified Duganella]
MFLDKLTEAQQGVVLSLTTTLMNADGKVTPQETALLDTLRQQMRSSVTPAKVELSELPTVFPTRAARIAMLLELLGMALIDNEYHVNEQDFISAIGNALQISQTELVEMESWVRRQFALVREAEHFMED